MSNEKDKQEDKTPEQILTEWSPRPETGYHSSWLIPAMKEYSDQQLAAYKEKLKKHVREYGLDSYTMSTAKFIQLIDQL